MITVKQRQARMQVGVNVMTLTVDIMNSSQAWRESEPKVCSIITEEGGICVMGKAARAERNSDGDVGVRGV